MNKSIIALSILAFTVGTITTLYGQKPDPNYEMVSENLPKPPKNVVNAKQELMKAHINFMSEFQNFKKKADIRINCNEKVFADFKVNLSKLNRSDKGTFQKIASGLELENTNLQNKLANYNKAEGQAKWKVFKRAFNHDMNSLGVRMWSVN